MSFILGLFTGLFVAIVIAFLKSTLDEIELEKTMKKFIEENKEKEDNEVEIL